MYFISITIVVSFIITKNNNMIKYIGTHNSGTSGELVWWQKPLKYFLNKTSKCQNLSIREQLDINTKLFNLQVTKYDDEWVFSHGFCIYKEKLEDALNLMVKYATKESPIYYQLVLDKNFLRKQYKKSFEIYAIELIKKYTNKNVVMLNAKIEGDDGYIYESHVNLDISEKYWTFGGAMNEMKGFKDIKNLFPNPKKHAVKYNMNYIKNNSADYLMLDYIEYGLLGCMCGTIDPNIDCPLQSPHKWKCLKNI